MQISCVLKLPTAGESQKNFVFCCMLYIMVSLSFDRIFKNPDKGLLYHISFSFVSLFVCLFLIWTKEYYISNAEGVGRV